MNSSKNYIREAYEAILNKANSNKSKKSLALINEICLEQLQSGEKNFSISNIGAISTIKGGPNTGAIRNKTGHLYKDLIKVYAESIDKPKLPVAKRNEHGWVDDIESSTARWLVRDLISDKSKLLAEVNQLRADLLNAEVPIQLYNKGDLSSKSQTFHQKTNFTISEINSLKFSIDPSYLKMKELIVGQHGRIEDLNTGKVIFKPGFVQAIEKILDVYGESY
ncbi:MULTISPECIES: gamma-mobile-trio protein GmtX [Vibrio]|uniref:Alpha/beta hydrolase n=1 Tax=Vibrio anguillarum TaxID=55601 RepID=A0ABD4QYH9_VIBAN|nr:MULTISPECIES: gamma-mobile-trio protein GmtX [Vibrio]MBT2920196.1 hypothetical protein [Vibrio anguillarum]NNN70513.1 hypothetical protein [Vibrio sp. 3-2(1)]PXA70467.1 hypothetical protein DMC15_13200 [Vibrio sp. 11986-1-5]